MYFLLLLHQTCSQPKVEGTATSSQVAKLRPLQLSDSHHYLKEKVALGLISFHPAVYWILPSPPGSKYPTQLQLGHPDL
jgi:hypothetical protein